jgi:hypothetical protein
VTVGRAALALNSPRMKIWTGFSGGGGLCRAAWGALGHTRFGMQAGAWPTAVEPEHYESLTIHATLETLF